MMETDADGNPLTLAEINERRELAKLKEKLAPAAEKLQVRGRKTDPNYPLPAHNKDAGWVHNT